MVKEPTETPEDFEWWKRDPWLLELEAVVPLSEDKTDHCDCDVASIEVDEDSLQDELMDSPKCL